MVGEVRSIEANDIIDWANWRPKGTADELQWFTVTIGEKDQKGGDLFQVCIASVAWLRQSHEKFVGLSVERFDTESIRRTISDFVGSIEAPDWPRFAQALARQMHWEYAGLSQ